MTDSVMEAEPNRTALSQLMTCRKRWGRREVVRLQQGMRYESTAFSLN